MRSVHVWLLTAALAALALFQDRRWKPLEVFDSDEGGYYAYLPAAFIYGDLGRADSLTIIQKAQLPPKERNLGLLRLENGKVISKYPMGVALVDLPWFWGAHGYAGLTGRPQDGFSRPYQQVIMLAGLVHALLGLWIVRRLLLRYYDDRTTAFAVAGIGLGTNFLVYASYNAAMAHAPLFMWQAALLYCTARWYQGFQLRFALGIGLFVGLAVLTRPTEIIYALVPLSWGAASWQLLRTQRPLPLVGALMAAIGVAALVVSFQAAFWHATSGHWLLYSYGDEQFDFAHPHLLEGLFSFRKGWLLYSPLAGLALLGLWSLRRYGPAAVLPIMTVVPVLLYVTFSWESWWYGGGFGARPLVSLYPLLALPLAALLAGTSRWRKVAQGATALLIVLNLWQTYQYGAGVILADKYTAALYFHNFFHASLH